MTLNKHHSTDICD